LVGIETTSLFGGDGCGRRQLQVFEEMFTRFSFLFFIREPIQWRFFALKDSTHQMCHETGGIKRNQPGQCALKKIGTLGSPLVGACLPSVPPAPEGENTRANLLGVVISQPTENLPVEWHRCARTHFAKPLLTDVIREPSKAEY
jgi:hypothetical protein